MRVRSFVVSLIMSEQGRIDQEWLEKALRSALDNEFDGGQMAPHGVAEVIGFDVAGPNHGS